MVPRPGSVGRRPPGPHPADGHARPRARRPRRARPEPGAGDRRRLGHPLVARPHVERVEPESHARPAWSREALIEGPRRPAARGPGRRRVGALGGRSRPRQGRGRPRAPEPVARAGPRRG